MAKTRTPPRQDSQAAPTAKVLIPTRGRKTGPAVVLASLSGCGILPCGAYRLGFPTQVPDRYRNAMDQFAELLAEMDSTLGGPAPDHRPASVASPAGAPAAAD